MVKFSKILKNRVFQKYAAAIFFILTLYAIFAFILLESNPLKFTYSSLFMIAVLSITVIDRIRKGIDKT